METLLKSFITLFVIIDPLGSLPIFVSLTNSLSKSELKKNSRNAIFVAGFLLLIFLFFGVQMFKFFNININSFMIAGGIVLLVIGILYVLGIQIYTINKKEKDKDVASVPIGTPLLAGPGAITSIIILANNYGTIIPLIALFLTLIISWSILRYSHILYKLIGIHGAKILSRVMGFILTAIAVEFIISGILGHIK